MTLDKSLLEAYNTTIFKVFNTSIEIRIGYNCPALDDLLIANNCTEWAFITPYNPHSTKFRFPKVDNYLRLAELKKDLVNYKIFEGEGIGTDPNWLPERSFLILGIDKNMAEELGKKYEQNAIVIGSKAERAELQLL